MGDNHLRRKPIAIVDFDCSGVTLVDQQATAETMSLFAYLKNIGHTNMLFGHQNTNSQGVCLTNNDGTSSDVKNAVGTYPALYGWDTLALIGEEGTFEELVMWGQAAIEEGAIITISAHMPNFTKVVKVDGVYEFKYAPGKTDTHGDVVASILDKGSEANKAFLAYLDIFAAYASQLKNKLGELYPIIFRPWHENSGSWFWWGLAHCTSDQYVRLFRYTVDYLRDTKQVHNLLYAYSPNGNFTNHEDYLRRYPGDDYIDIIGFDLYHDNPCPGDGKIEELLNDARVVVEIAKTKNKVAAMTETGIRHTHKGAEEDYGLHPTNNGYKNWFTDLLKAIKDDKVANQLSYMMLWRNDRVDHSWVPYKGHPILGDHEMLDDFVEFYEDDFMVFSDRLQKVYDLDVKNKGLSL